MKKRKILALIGDVAGLAVCFIVFVIPFLFMILNSLKDKKSANKLSLSLPEVWHWENFREVFETRNYIILTAFKNSFILTAGAVFILIIVGSMAGYVIQRRRDKVTAVANILIMSGLMIPPAILPGIWVMQRLHIYKTLFGMILVETALNIPFTIMLYRGFMSSVPVELEEAGYIDGCERFELYRKIIFPLLKPVTATVIILCSVGVFNDFTNPLYFLPGSKNTTVQLTLYSFMGQFSSSYHLLFANVLIITIPMLILFLIFNKKIVAGMTAGAVKG